MEKEKRILFYFIGWFIVAVCIFLIGVLNVDAATYDSTQFTAQLYDNYGPGLSSVTTNYTNNRWEGTIPQMVANSSGGAWAITSPIALIENHNYSITLEIDGTYGGNLVLSTFNRIGIGRWLDDAIYSYENGTAVDTIYSRVVGSSVQYAFTSKLSSSYIIIPFATNYSGSLQTFSISNVIIEDLGSDSLTQEEINTSLNNQTNILNSSINNSTNTITGAIGETENNINSNIDDMESAIVDSNKETQDVIKDQFNSCRDSNNLFNKNNILSVNDTIATPTDTGFNVKGSWYVIYNANDLNGTYTINYKFVKNSGPNSFYRGKVRLLYTDNTYSDYYDAPYTFNANNNINKILFYVDSGTDLLDANFNDVTLNKGTSYKPYEPYGEEICSNKIDDTNDKLDDLQSSITDDSSPDIDGLADSAGWLPPGPLDSVLNLPLSLFNSLTTNLNKSCSPINLPLPYVNKNLTIPCINTLYEKIGISTFMTWLGVIVSGFMLYTYLLKLYKWIEDRISLNETHSVDNWGGL